MQVVINMNRKRYAYHIIIDLCNIDIQQFILTLMQAFLYLKQQRIDHRQHSLRH